MGISVKVSADYRRADSKGLDTIEMWILIEGIELGYSAADLLAAYDGLSIRPLKDPEWVEFVLLLPVAFEGDQHRSTRSNIWGHFVDRVRNKHPDKDRLSFAASTRYY